MATTPEPIEYKNLPASATTIYTAFVNGGITRALIATIEFTNTTAADVTVDAYKEVSGPTDYYFIKGLTVPANSTLSWRGIIVCKTSGDLIRALASVSNSIDIVGAVMES